MNSDHKIQWSETKPYIPPVTEGQCIKVYDGDTITIATMIPYDKENLYRFSIRLAGIDTPEIRGPEKEKAELARNTLSNLVLHKKVTLKNVSNEKYGRVLADVYVGDLNVNKWMITHKLAVPYDGGTKDPNAFQ